MRALSVVIVILIFIEIISAQDYWQWQSPSPQGNVLFSVYKIDKNNAVAVGDSGTVFKITNTARDAKIISTGNFSTYNLKSVGFVIATF